MSGKARGRARGRARGTEQAAQQPVRRPGEAAAQPPAMAAPPPAAAAPQGAVARAIPLKPGGQQSSTIDQSALATSTGRATHRGGTRPRPGPPVEEMGAMSLRETGQGDRREFHRSNDEKVICRRISDKRGTSGLPVNIVANYFSVDSRPDWCLYQYRAEFSPEIDSKRLRIGIVYGQTQRVGETIAFDGTTLYVAHRLPDDVMEFTVMCESIGGPVRVQLRLTSELPPNDPTCLQMYNIIFRRHLKNIDMKQIGRHYFSPSLRITVNQHQVDVWPGYATSIGEYEGGRILLCADVSHKLLRTPNVLEELLNIGTRNPNFREEATKLLVGQIILTRYNNRTYRVDDIDWNMNPLSVFQKRDGTTISIKDYYETQYGLKISDENQPLLVSRPKARDRIAGQTEPFKLVPQFSHLTGISDRMKSDYTVMRDLGQHTRVGPQDRANRLMELIRRLSQNPTVQREMEGWNMSFANTLLRLKGRIQEPEKIIQGGNKSFFYRPDTAEWTAGMRGNPLGSAVRLDRWILIFVKRDMTNAEALCRTLIRVGAPMGIQISQPRICPLDNDRVDTYTRTILSTLTPEDQLVVCIVPNNRKDRYDAIKKVCCVDNPVPSQVVVSRTISKQQQLMSVATKIAIQINCKLGGEAWALEIPAGDLMVCGFDSYHDSAKRGQSVGAFVSSYNRTLTRYYSRCMFQSNTQELLDGLRGCVKGALRKYQEVNGKPPVRVVIYRDGVGDGQLEQVYRYELKQILEAFSDFKENYLPKFALIVVKKRINTRLFVDNNGRMHNPPPGTIVDEVVTRPMWYDFFIVSQSVRQGTVSPTHYNVIHDAVDLLPDHIQRLTYKLCHLYYNWPGTIRVPAPCQYAHKLAFLVGQSLHREPAHALSDRLFYL